MNRALFLDRDGIFNKVVFRDGGMHSPRNWQEVELESGLEILDSIKTRGFKLIMVTNQPDIERKIVSEKFVVELHNHYRNKYALDGIYCCPFSSNEHPDKKPNSGMLDRASVEHGINLERSFLLGDTERDMLASRQCGVSFILLDRPYNKDLPASKRIRTFNEIGSLIF